MPTIVDRPDPERAQLAALCRERGLSRAEALRQPLRLWLQHSSQAIARCSASGTTARRTAGSCAGRLVRHVKDDAAC